MKNKNIDITQDFERIFYRKSALVIYESEGIDTDVYVEHFDMDGNGNTINGHLFTVWEADVWLKPLWEHEKESALLKPKAVLPSNVLNLYPSTLRRTVIWHTKAQERKLFLLKVWVFQMVTPMLRVCCGKQVNTVLWYLLFKATAGQP